MPHPTSSTSQRPAAFAPCPASGVTSGSIPDTPSGSVSCATSRPAPAATPGSVLCTTSGPAPAATPRPAAISVVRPSTATAASPVAAAAPVSAAFPVPLFAATITAVSGSSGPLPAAACPSAPGRAATAGAVRSRISPPESESQILRAIFRSTRKCWPSAFLALTSLILFQQFIITAVHARSVHDKSAVPPPKRNPASASTRCKAGFEAYAAAKIRIIGVFAKTRSAARATAAVITPVPGTKPRSNSRFRR